MSSLPPLTAADLPQGVVPAAHVLSNGSYTVLLTTAGGGYSALGEFALTRWSADRTLDADGFFLLLHDDERGTRWSAGHQPSRHRAERYAARFTPGQARIERMDDGVETTLEVCVAPDADVELRRFTLTNRSAERRRMALTTYVEAVLNTAAADAAHPAFSKLFVQTEYDAARGLLLARRRQRSPDDLPLCVAHALEREGGDSGDGLELESDRARFIGRGRTLERPAAVDEGARLSGTVGNVLDPVLCLRRRVELAPGESVRFVALLAAAPSRGEVEALAGRFAGSSGARAADAAFAGAAARAERLLSELELTSEEVAARLPALLGALAYAHRDLRAGADRGRLDDGTLLRAAARLLAEGGEVAVADVGAAHAGRPVSFPADLRSATTAPRGLEPLRFFNGHGGFSEDGTEYVVRLDATPAGPRRPPLPWSNVVANERVGFLASESGAGYTWSVNSREHRLTPWLNDPVTDPHGEALYLRDEADGAFWTPTPGPAPAAAAYEVRHGFGYTRYAHASRGLEQEVVQFVPRHDPVKIVRLRVTNRGDVPRRLSAFSYSQWVLGVHAWQSGRTVRSEARHGAVLATNPDAGEFSGLVAFAAAVSAAAPATVHFTADRQSFIGPYGTMAAPAALGSPVPLDERTGAGLDPCAAFQVPLEVAPGATTECLFLLGEGASEEEVVALLARYRAPGAAAAALDEVRAFWRHTLSAVQVSTPSPALDVMVNGWLSYQNLACRVWGRSALYQSGGAYGYRDQLQDTAALVYLAPHLTRRQIVLHAAHQFVEGDVLHWWHPPLGKGMRTRFSDDLLWLPFVAAGYVETTGDESVLEEEARFVTGPFLDRDEDERFVEPVDSGERGTVYEHCCRALDRSLTAGVHGLPLMGTGDWNDGMNRVGREGRGESVWLGFFLSYILDRFISLCDRRGDAERAARFRAYAERLVVALNEGGWDGDWYRRAYYDDGAPLGSAANDECRIDTIAQAWAVISGAAPPQRAAQALDAMEHHLVSEGEGIIRLLTPAFDRTPHDPGYIKGYLPGVRENGGQYTHAALWAVKALAEFGRGERAARLLEMLSPVSRASTAGGAAIYQVEPYVIAADVYGVAPHVGRGGWTWYTGSAGWAFRVAVESVLGVRIVGGRTLELRPCVPAAWPGFTVRYRLPDGETVYEIVARRGPGDADACLEGAGDEGDVALEDGAVSVRLRADGGHHRVLVTLGEGLGPRYAPGEAASPSVGRP